MWSLYPMARAAAVSASRLNFGVSPALARPSNSDNCTEQALLRATQTETSPGSTRRRIGPDRINGNSIDNLARSRIEAFDRLSRAASLCALVPSARPRIDQPPRLDK